jgi:hypothetical protein
MREKPLKKILLAVHVRSHATWAAALKSEFVPVACETLASAQKALNDDIDLILCGMNFDSSRMFDLLQYAKDHPKLKTIPFVCINGFEPVHKKSSIANMKESIRLLGAEFVDLWGCKQKFGEEKSYEKLIGKLHRLMA